MKMFITVPLKMMVVAVAWGTRTWDAAVVPGIDDSSYTIQDGQVQVPNRPGFGLTLDRQVYDSAIKDDGFIAKG